MQKLNQIFIFILLAVGVIASGCEKKTSSGGGIELNVSGIILPDVIEGNVGDKVEFSYIGNKGPKSGDRIKFLSVNSDLSYSTSIADLADKSFSILIPEGIISGRYYFSVSRGELEKRIGTVEVRIKSSIKIEPNAGDTVYGAVETKDGPVSGVVVSDGYEVTVTDENGIYHLSSKKAHGYVFVSVPDGYSTILDGTRPRLHNLLSKPYNMPERSDFFLVKNENQSIHTMLFVGDIHLANRNNDVAQFQSVTDDINAYIKGKENLYAFTLGDLTWDIYWQKNGYDHLNYLNDINRIKGIPVFNTIGNHDHSCYIAGDSDSAGPYKERIAPTYYSFNIGNIHYVSLDNIVANNTGNYDDSDYGRRHSMKIADEQIEWLKKDLSYVGKDKTLIIAMHAYVFPSSTALLPSLGNGTKLLAAVKGYKVHFFTGHSHRMWNVDKLESDNYYEHNSGAACGTWWWTGKYTDGLNISADGTPAGYTIVKINGNDVRWIYKAAAKPESYQFRTYDGNEIYMTQDKYVPNANSEYANIFLTHASDWTTASTDNKVFINVWNYDSYWKIDVKENGKSLKVDEVNVKDPLHLIAYEAKRCNANAGVSFATHNAAKMFVVTASSPSSNLDITVTNRFGEEFKETMKRPKAFNLENYK